jgi:hypothetical protein
VIMPDAVGKKAGERNRYSCPAIMADARAVHSTKAQRPVSSARSSEGPSRSRNRPGLLGRFDLALMFEVNGEIEAARVEIRDQGRFAGGKVKSGHDQAR